MLCLCKYACVCWCLGVISGVCMYVQVGVWAWASVCNGLNVRE